MQLHQPTQTGPTPAQNAPPATPNTWAAGSSGFEVFAAFSFRSSFPFGSFGSRPGRSRAVEKLADCGKWKYSPRGPRWAERRRAGWWAVSFHSIWRAHNCFCSAANPGAGGVTQHPPLKKSSKKSFKRATKNTREMQESYFAYFFKFRKNMFSFFPSLSYPPCMEAHN